MSHVVASLGYTQKRMTDENGATHFYEIANTPDRTANVVGCGFQAGEGVVGFAKAEMIEHEENLAAATGYLVQKGALEKCEYHDEVYGGGFFQLEDEFWRYAMADRNRGDNGPVPWAARMQAREFTDLLKQSYEDHCGDCCGWCAKNASE